MQRYFPEIGDDLTKVTWGHAVNSKQLLDEAIQGETYRMSMQAMDHVMHLRTYVYMEMFIFGRKCRPRIMSCICGYMFT